MRGATECAKRLKLLFSSLRSKLGKVSHPAMTDPITQLILGVLSRDTPEARASEGLDRLRGMVVDYNELRVIPPIELAEVLADFADARLKCEDIARALNSIFAREHAITLERLLELSKRDVVADLERVDGLEPYSRARIRLLGLRQHAIPLDEAMWAYARREEIVEPRCGLDEAQRFLERQVAADDALEFVALLRKQAWEECGAAVTAGKVERILSVPPDRTARNMLQLVTRDLAAAEDEALGVDEDLEGELMEEEPVLASATAEPARARRKGRKAGGDAEGPKAEPSAGKRTRKAAGKAKRTAARKTTKKARVKSKSSGERRGEKARKGGKASRAGTKRAGRGSSEARSA